MFVSEEFIQCIHVVQPVYMYVSVGAVIMRILKNDRLLRCIFCVEDDLISRALCSNLQYLLKKTKSVMQETCVCINTIMHAHGKEGDRYRYINNVYKNQSLVYQSPYHTKIVE